MKKEAAVHTWLSLRLGGGGGPWRQHGGSLPDSVRVDNKGTVCLCHIDYGP